MSREIQTQAAGRWKQVVADGLYNTGVLEVFHQCASRYEYTATGPRHGRMRRVRSARYLVLGYHRVGTAGVPLYCTLPQQVFAQQMRYVAEHYRVLSVEQMVEELRDPQAQGQGVVVTFDDGYLGTFTEAFPILQKYKIPATVYLTGEPVETGEIAWYDRIFLRFQKASSELTVVLATPRTFRLSSPATRIEAATEVVMYLRTVPDERRQAWCEEFAQQIPLSSDELQGAMMTWTQACLMQESGISFGAHTMSHPAVSRLAGESLTRELSESKSLIEKNLGVAVQHFAFPFGKPRDCGTTAAPELARLGFRTALTTIIGLNKAGADPFRLRRLVVGNDTSLAKFALQIQRLFFNPIDEEMLSASTEPGI